MGKAFREERGRALSLGRRGRGRYFEVVTGTASTGVDVCVLTGGGMWFVDFDGHFDSNVLVSLEG